jgi:hypothetical protein
VAYPKSCEEVKADLQQRHKPFIEHWSPKPIDDDAFLHRLVREQDIDKNTKKPSKSSFSNYGLSVYVESENYPLNIRKCVKENDIFVGAVKLRAKDVEAMGYEICLDPHPDPKGNPQHPNHAQIICKKTQGNMKKMTNLCEWSVYPDCIDRV